METIVHFISLHAHQAHWIIFSLLILAGLNIPISEDLLLIVGGAIASTCVPCETYHLFVWIFLGCWISAWEAYWIGRFFGPKLYEINWFRRLITPDRIDKLRYYYEKFGVLTFIVGRFIPGGVRNVLFMTTGLARMPFHQFLVRDGLACLISATTIFTIGYYFGESIPTLIHYMKAYHKVILGCFILILAIIGIVLWQASKTKEKRLESL
jgi:membrane protein DedA with SNARE-associated domain